jgi:uncharacterized repeat protein (TIGR01451 family)
MGYSSSTDGDIKCSGSGVVIIKLSVQGEILWQKCIASDLTYSLIKTKDNGFAIIGRSNPAVNYANTYDAWVAKLSSVGNIEWQKSFGGLGDDRFQSIQQTSDKGFIIVGYTTTRDGSGDVTFNHGDLDIWLVKLTATGTLEWQKSLGGKNSDNAWSVIQTADGGYALAGLTLSNDGDVSGYHNKFGGTNGYEDMWVVKLSALGNVQWQKCLGGSLQDIAYSIIQTSDGGYMIGGYSSSNDGDITKPLGSEFSDGWIIKLSPTGSLQWQKSLGGTSFDRILSMSPTTDGGYLVSGYTTSNDLDATGNHGNYDIWIVKLTSDLKIVLGTVQQSTTSCQPLQTPQYFTNIQVKIENNSKAYYASVDSLGRFGVIADTGRFSISAIPPNNLWSLCSPQIITISKPGIRDTARVNAYLFPNTICPFMEVELTTPFLRRCFESQYVISYANRGTAIQNDAVVELTLDSMLTYVSATRPVRSRIGNKISFSIGNVGINQTGQFNVSVMVSCNSLLGQAHCSSVVIPKAMACDSIRDTIPSIISQCVSGCDSLLFLVKKPTATQSQNQAFQYKLIANTSVIDTGRFISTNDFSLKRKKDERSFRLEIRNANNQLVAARSQESTLVTPSVSSGFVTQFSNAVKLSNRAENCTTNRGAYDPNDKSAIPVGVGTSRFVEQGTAIEYLIQFQNTGTDTAFKVVVKDTLSPHFNLSSYKTLAASHPHTWQLNPNGVLTFTFDNIKLVDSFTNEKGSHGFFRYQIRLKDSVATSTKIDNKAAIYFDFNTPIITNIAGHTLGKEFLKNCLAKPIVSITTTGCPSKNIVFNAVTKNGGLNPTYAWFRNNETTPLSTNASLTLNNTVNGTKVYCNMTASSDLCTETPVVTSDTFRITCITSKIEAPSIVQLFEVFPNPNKGQFGMKLTLEKMANVQISFLNALGQVLKTESIETSDFEAQYDFSHFSDGIYLLKLTIEGQSKVKKIHIFH